MTPSIGIQQAIDAIKRQLDLPVGEDARYLGQTPSESVYRRGFAESVYGSTFRVHTVVVVFNLPPDRADIDEDDAATVYANAEAFVDWVHTQPKIGGHFIYWPTGITTDIGNNVAEVVLPLCLRYP